MQQLLLLQEKRLPAGKICSTALLLLLAALLLCGCASKQEQTLVYQSLARNDYEKALKTLEAKTDDYYGETDEVLYLLDSGVVAHYAGRFQDSNAKLSFAERLIEEYYATSIGQSVSSWFVNDLVKDYEGEEYEDIYGNIFMALNYIQMGMIEDAFVEIRRFDNKQRLLQTKYADAQMYAEQQLKNKKNVPKQTSVQFNNSALARYLSMILYRSEKQLDNAAVDRRYITQAFETESALYDFAEPDALLDEELNVPAGMARLNLVSFTGIAPEKRERRIRWYDDESKSYFTIAYPYIVRRPSSVRKIRATVTDEYGNKTVLPFEQIESIENIAIDTFAQKEAVIFSKSLIRAMTKSITGNTLRQAADEISPAASELMTIFTAVAQEASEQADTRSASFFPAKVYIAGVTLKPGIYTVTCEYLDARGNVIHTTRQEDVAVREKSINLTESLCLR